MWGDHTFLSFILFLKGDIYTHTFWKINDYLQPLVYGIKSSKKHMREAYQSTQPENEQTE